MALIVLVAALNIATSLALLVVERRPDIAILAAVGARPLNIMIIFLLEGALIGAIGAATGVALGLCVAYVGNRYQLISLPADVYSISSVPFMSSGET
ncbi:MAG: FtsX-like permease family protein [Pyrinomonadaceae bacterium]